MERPIGGERALMINAVAVPIFLLYYFLIRNNILAKRYSEKIVQLEKMKVDQLENAIEAAEDAIPSPFPV